MTVVICLLGQPVGVISGMIIVSGRALLGAPDVGNGGLSMPLGGQLVAANCGPAVICLTRLCLGNWCLWVFESHYSATGP